MHPIPLAGTPCLASWGEDAPSPSLTSGTRVVGCGHDDRGWDRTIDDIITGNKPEEVPSSQKRRGSHNRGEDLCDRLPGREGS